MIRKPFFSGAALFACGIILGGLCVSQWKRPMTVAAMEQDQAKAAPDPATIQADIDQLKSSVPSQSHTMTDVAFQFTNLWFAGQKKNWPLADFYLNETRSHIRWTIRLRPVRKDPAGNNVDLRPIYDTMDKGIFTKLKDVIDKKDSTQFPAVYRQTMTACYGCHQASGKPFLRPVIPTAPAQTIISFDPEEDASR